MGLNKVTVPERNTNDVRSEQNTTSNPSSLYKVDTTATSASLIVDNSSTGFVTNSSGLGGCPGRLSCRAETNGYNRGGNLIENFIYVKVAILKVLAVQS